MKRFENIENNSFTFSSCDICDARCCDGARGSIFAPINLEDFEVVSKNFPIVFTKGNLGYIMPAVLLSNGLDFCRYIKDFKCSIYEQRPSVCRVYPFSPSITNEVFIDTFCPAVNQEGKVIVRSGEVSDEYKHIKFENHQDKTVDTYNHFSQFNEDDLYEELIVINDVKFYRFKEDMNDKYLKMHIDSQNYFDKYFIL